MKQGAEQRNATGEEGGEDRSGGEEIAHDSHRPGIGRFAETVMQPVKPTSVSAVDGPDNQRITARQLGQRALSVQQKWQAGDSTTVT